MFYHDNAQSRLGMSVRGKPHQLLLDVLSHLSHSSYFFPLEHQFGHYRILDRDIVRWMLLNSM